ncbi:MAG: hypothetical protein KJ792_08805 [Actinobacteria bacterium]|nr:hypothetical protein [Actinomycetota bacterium]MCG2801351.1 hypothetical protein [Cellulomonas sp.]
MRPALLPTVAAVLLLTAACTTGSASSGATTAAIRFTACPTGMSCGAHLVDGLGARKAQVLAAGATTQELAVAMLESEAMTSDYVIGDGKAGDAANFGVFKQNWLMLRTACSTFTGRTAEQWSAGAALNPDLAADVACLQQTEAFYGVDAWFAGHRGGADGLATPGTADIASYRTAVEWIAEQLDADPANLGNDVRFWVDVPAI